MPKLVKDDELLKLMNEVAGESADIVNEVVEELIEPLQVVANPEKLIGKPFELWSDIDKQWLITIYGTDDNSILSKFIAKKAVEKLRELEAIANGGTENALGL